MTESTWEKSEELASKLRSKSAQRRIYMFAGLALIAVVAVLVVKSMILGAAYYKTVEEIVNDSDIVGKKVRVSGVIVQEDGRNKVELEDGVLTFTIAHIPNDNDSIREAGGLGAVLTSAVNNPDLPTLDVVYADGEIPDLVWSEDPTQAIIEGRLDENGVFQATSLQLKCPTKYSDEVPNDEQIARN